MNRRFIAVPISNRKNQVVAVAFVSPTDKWVTNYRWRLAGNGYAARSVKVNGRSSVVYMHREILGLDRRHRATEADHWNKDHLDNRRENLRPVSKSEQQQNRGASKGSRFPRGVALDTRRNHYTARCTLEGRTYFLGSFSTPEQAGEAAARFRAEFMPFSPEAAA